MNRPVSKTTIRIIRPIREPEERAEACDSRASCDAEAEEESGSFSGSGVAEGIGSDVSALSLTELSVSCRARVDAGLAEEFVRGRI